MPDDDRALGIIPTGRNDPYAEEDSPEDDMLAMFEDADDSDETDVPAEPATLPDDDEDDPQPPPPPEPDDDETAQAPEGEALVEGDVTAQEIDDEVRLLAGRFPDTDEGLAQLENSYKEAQGWATRAMQELRAAEERQAGTDEEVAQLQAQLQQLTGTVIAQMRESDPEFAERLERQQEIQRQIAAAMPEEEEYDPEEEAAYAFQQQAAANVAAFYQRTGVVPQGPEDAKIQRAMNVLLAAGAPIDMRSAAHLDAVYAASGDDNLLYELAMAPNAINVPGGVERLRARTAGGTIPATSGAPSPEQETQPPATQRPRRRRIEAHVETPGGGVPPPAAPGQPADEWDEIEAAYKKRYSKGPIFGSVRT